MIGVTRDFIVVSMRDARVGQFGRRPYAMSLSDLADPRTWPDAAAADAASVQVHAAVVAALGAQTLLDADRHDADARQLLLRMLTSSHAPALADALASAPSVAVARHLWRLLAEIERGDKAPPALRTTLFAIPVILVTGLDAGTAPVVLSGVLPKREELEQLLRAANAFDGGETFALAGTLCGAEAIDVAALPRLLAHRHIDAHAGHRLPQLDFAPSPIDVQGRTERVHLRFIAGAALTPAGADPLRDTRIAAWGMSFAKAIALALAAPGTTLLALPRAPQRLTLALQSGRAAQREVSAQLFASNAIRKLRASVGEPTAVISAHRAIDAPAGGELRLSLSSPFAPRDAEGFRCPLYPYEPVRDVAIMLVALLGDCQVADIRVRRGVHADRDPATGGPLLFKAADTTQADASC